MSDQQSVVLGKYLCLFPRVQQHNYKKIFKLNSDSTSPNATIF